MFNGTMMQYFKYFLPSGCKLWNGIYNEAKKLSDIGITAIWLPPAYKGMGGNSDVGYSVYDLYDLGEFYQKGSKETKYGNKEEYIQAIEKLHSYNIQVYGDIVLNHKMGADFTEEINCQEVQQYDRNKVINEEKIICGWTGFEFAGRDNKYSEFKWDYRCFTAVDYDEYSKKKSIYKFKGKDWSVDVDDENGNYDYLMGCDIDFSNENVLNEIERWGKWYLSVTGIDGMRLDAIKHISAGFYKKWIKCMRGYTGKELFSVGEYWHGDVEVLLRYIEKTDGVMSLFDVPLHYNFYEASHNCNYDMRNIFKGTLVERNEVKAVTFVDNHDTEKGASLESPVAEWFKLIAYGLILLRKAGYPCIFYDDYYADKSGNKEVAEGLKKLLDIRKNLAYGEEKEYFDDCNIVGWTRGGIDELKDSGIAVIISNNGDGYKEMYIGEKFKERVFVDIMGRRKEEVKINKSGIGMFYVSDKSISVWVLKKMRYS